MALPYPNPAHAGSALPAGYALHSFRALPGFPAWVPPGTPAAALTAPSPRMCAETLAYHSCPRNLCFREPSAVCLEYPSLPSSPHPFPQLAMSSVSRGALAEKPGSKCMLSVYRVPGTLLQVAGRLVQKAAPALAAPRTLPPAPALCSLPCIDPHLDSASPSSSGKGGE